MNGSYLTKEFSNPLFLEVYKSFLEKMNDQFDIENADRVKRFVDVIIQNWKDRTIYLVLSEKKLPWTENYKYIVQNLAQNLLDSYATAPKYELIIPMKNN